MTRRLVALPLVIALLWATVGCGPPSRVAVSGGGGDAAAPTAAEVERAVEVTLRDGNVIYRAPRLSTVRPVDLRRGGPTLGRNLGVVSLGQSGFLFGIRTGKTDQLSHHAAFQSDFVTGTNRFRAVTLADGTTPSFRIVPSDRMRCEPACYLIFETLVVDLPEAALRGATTTGLTLSIALDNGAVVTASAPAAYVQGYLAAVAARR